MSMFYFLNLINFCLHPVFVASSRLSLVAASRGYSLVVVPGLLIMMASLSCSVTSSSKD